MQKILGCVIALLVILMLSPWLTGMWFEHTYRKLISFYNSQSEIDIQVLEYQRGWWKSKAVIYIHIMSPELREYFADTGVTNPELDVTLEQSIQHGPLILRPDSPSFFGLAFIQNIVHLSKDLQQVMQSSIVNQPIKIEGIDFVTFRGNYYKYFSVSPFQLSYAKNNLQIYFNQGIHGDFWVSPGQKRIRGDVNLLQLMIVNGGNNVISPSISIQFDQHQSKSGLWVGQLATKISEMSWLSDNEQQVYASGVAFQGMVDEKSGELFGLKRLDVDQLNFAGRLMGPVHIQVSASGLSAKGVVDLIATYKKIMKRGELYESQLRQRIFSLLPDIISKQTELKIDDMEVVSPEGVFQLTGKMNWPTNEISSDGFAELYQDSQAQAHLRVSKSFLNKMIDDASQLPYFRSITNERRNELLDLQDSMQTATQRNFLFLSGLTMENALSEDSALQLLALQRNDESLDAYQEMIKKFFLERQISRQISYQLYWQYIAVKQQVSLLDQALNFDQQAVKQQILSQVNEWVKSGYILQDKNDYVISVQKNNETVKLNGKEI